MPNPLSKVVAFILFVFLVVIVPVYNMLWMIDRHIYNQVNVITNRFQKEVRNQGYVSKDIYETFTKELANTGRVYDITMIHRKIEYYPLDPSSPDYSASKPYSVEYFKYTESDILGKIYDATNPGDYKMSSGDDFNVTVRERDGYKGSRILWNFFGGIKSSTPVVYAEYGGMVENEDY